MKKKDSRNKELIADEWFEKACDDLRAAEVILNNREGPASTVCFLSQQTAEKYLKGYLVYHTKEFPKIHYLGKLIALCQKLDSDFEKIKEDAVLLSDYYMTTRYPGDYPTLGYIAAKEAFGAAVRIKDFVFDKIYGKRKAQ